MIDDLIDSIYKDNTRIKDNLIDDIYNNIEDTEDKTDKDIKSPIGSIVFRPTLNKKRTVSFLSIRKWRLSTKQSDIHKFKQAKLLCNNDVIEIIAKEIVCQLNFLFLNLHNFIVTSPPQGASYGSGRLHFASLLAQSVAENLVKCEYKAFFASRPRKGGSHPKTFDKRGELELIADLNDTPIILIDDIATSGTTIEECMHRLSQKNIVIPIAWVYGGIKD
jgi:hypoxanthine-guanine phosphoribosyltransferase